MIKLESKTQYFAKKRLIEAALDYFIDNPNSLTVEIVSNYEGGSFRMIVSENDLCYKMEVQALGNELKKRLDKKTVKMVFAFLSAMNNYHKLVKG